MLIGEVRVDIWGSFKTWSMNMYGVHAFTKADDYLHNSPDWPTFCQRSSNQYPLACHAMAPLLNSWTYVPHRVLFYIVGAVSVILIHSEWHIQAPRTIAVHTALVLCLATGKHFTRNIGLEEVLKTLVLMSRGYMLGVVGSITIYRVFLHRLTSAGFPGPWYAYISKL